MKDVNLYYNQKSESYDQTFSALYFKIYDLITWKFLEPYIPTNSNALVLDAAGGTGRWAIRMARKGCRVVLIDASEGMLRVARQRVKDEGLQRRITLKLGDVTRTGWDDETFDMVLCEHALFLFKQPEILLKELQRILKKKARLIVSAQNRYVQSVASVSDKPSPTNVNRAIKMLQGKERECLTEDGRVKIYTWTPDEFRAMLERSGFCLEKIVGKVVTMPLRIRHETYERKDYPEELFRKILKLELDLSERQDTLALAGHLQAITVKRGRAKTR